MGADDIQLLALKMVGEEGIYEVDVSTGLAPESHWAATKQKCHEQEEKDNVCSQAKIHPKPGLTSVHS